MTPGTRIFKYRLEKGMTQAELARKIATTQSVIARLEDAEYMGHPLPMLERIAAACGTQGCSSKSIACWGRSNSRDSIGA